MSNFSDAHGPEAAIAFTLSNTQESYDELQRITGRAQWDEDIQTWSNIDAAAKELRQYTSELSPTDRGDYSDLGGINMSEVNWDQIIIDELAEANVQAGRPSHTGLPKL